MTKLTSKLIAGVLALAVVGGGVCSLGYASRSEDGKWFGNGNISTWHWSDKSLGDVSDIDGNTVIGEGESSGISLQSAAIPVVAYDEYGIDLQAENAVVLTATITPAATTNKTVTWSTNDTSGKVKVTPVSDNPLQATVQVLGAFDKQVTITCTATSNSAAKATCTVDYVKSLKFQSYEYDINSKDEEYCFSQSLEFNKGTLTPTSAKGTVYFSWDTGNGLYNYLKARHSTIKSSVSFADVECNSLASAEGPEWSYCLSELFGTSDAKEIASIYSDIGTYCYGEEFYEIAYLSYDNVHQYYNGVEVAYEDGALIEVTCIMESFNDFIVNASGVTLNNGSLIFGENGQV